jgi:DNA polymerase III subunit chi
VPRVEGEYERLVYMFDGHDPEAVEEARAAWKALSADNDCTYWQQEANGRWVKKG